MNRALRIRRFLALEPTLREGSPLGRQQLYFLRSLTVRDAFYAATFLVALGHLVLEWPQWQTVEHAAPLWPASWVPLVGIKTGATLILVLSALFSLLGLAYPHVRPVRALVWLGLLQYLALNYSFGKISHGTHIWLWVAFVFIFLPDLRLGGRAPTRMEKRQHTYFVWAAQAVVLSFYTLSGSLKVGHGVYQALAGQLSLFSPDALASNIAFRVGKTEHATLLGEFLVDHSPLGMPLFLGAVYLEFAAALAIFRPQWHRIWGFGLIGMHCGIGFAMGIWNWSNLLVIGLLLVNSPFRPERYNLGDLARTAPLLGDLLKLAKLRPG